MVIFCKIYTYAFELKKTGGGGDILDTKKPDIMSKFDSRANGVQVYGFEELFWGIISTPMSK